MSVRVFCRKKRVFELGHEFVEPFSSQRRREETQSSDDVQTVNNIYIPGGHVSGALPTISWPHKDPQKGQCKHQGTQI